MAKKGGRPLKYKSKAELEKKIDEYFESCFGPAFDKKTGDPLIDFRTGEQLIRQFKPFTMAGLAYYLGIDRKTLLNYSKDDRFFPTIKKARSRVETYVEEQLFKPQIAAGVIFNLKNNFGWKDKTDEDAETAEDKVADRLNEVFGKIE